MVERGIYVEARIAAPLDAVWERTQAPDQHTRWDVRFSEIVPTASTESGAVRFTYTRRVPFHTVTGDGVSIGDASGRDGSRTSALRFATTDPWSPIRSGRGYWRYVPDGDGVRFITGYDYTPGWGPILDLVARPVLAWATAWSFDRLRLWAERGDPPEQWPLVSVLWFWRTERPRAARCRRAPARGRRRDDHLRDAPATLASLAAPGGTS